MGDVFHLVAGLLQIFTGLCDLHLVKIAPRAFTRVLFELLRIVGMRHVRDRRQFMDADVHAEIVAHHHHGPLNPGARSFLGAAGVTHEAVEVAEQLVHSGRCLHEDLVGLTLAIDV